jgi:hypothetical protein
MGKKSEQEKDVRLAATKQIWGWTTAILTISTPLAISHYSISSFGWSKYRYSSGLGF